MQLCIPTHGNLQCRFREKFSTEDGKVLWRQADRPLGASSSESMMMASSALAMVACARERGRLTGQIMNSKFQQDRVIDVEPHSLCMYMYRNTRVKK